MKQRTQQLLDDSLAFLVVGTAASIVALYILQGNWDWSVWGEPTQMAPIREGISALPWH